MKMTVNLESRELESKFFSCFPMVNNLDPLNRLGETREDRRTFSTTDKSMGAQALAGNFLARRFSILGSVRPGGGTEDHNLDTVRVFVHKSIKPIIRIKASDTERKDCISPIDFPVQRLSFSKSVT